MWLREMYINELYHLFQEVSSEKRDMQVDFSNCRKAIYEQWIKMTYRS